MVVTRYKGKRISAKKVSDVTKQILALMEIEKKEGIINGDCKIKTSENGQVRGN